MVEYKIARSVRSVYDRLGESCATTLACGGWEVLVTFINLPEPDALASVVRLLDTDNAEEAASEYGLFRNNILVGLADEHYNIITSYDAKYYCDDTWKQIGIATRYSDTYGIGEATGLPIVDDTSLGLFDGSILMYRTMPGLEWTLV